MLRLIAVIIIFAFFLVFIVFNLPNKCDISFGFTSFTDVPVFVSALFSFVLGMLFTIPLVFTIKKKYKKTDKSEEKTAESPSPVSGIKKRLWKFGKKDQQETGAVSENTSSGSEQVKKEDSPYGID